jgi:hypothetical protein
MIYTNNIVLIEDFSDNLYLFKLNEGTILSYGFQNKDNKFQEEKISDKALLEYDISIDNKNNIYTIYQDKSFYLILLIKTEESTKEIILTEEPMPEVFNLNLEIIDNFPHIFYNVFLEGKKYRIVHHYYNGDTWVTNLVGDIEINQVLNPMKIISGEEKIKLIYYNMKKAEEIYCKNFNFKEGKWEKEIKLTENPIGKLYLDALIIDGKLHLSYCEFDENLVVKYERYNLKDFQREIELEISNKENISWPTLIYHENILWIVWAEYENILSRFSLDMGDNWASIYLWKDIKDKDIVRYKYINKKDKNILNHSFGIFGEDIKFIGFGSLDNTIEIPLKKII